MFTGLIEDTGEIVEILRRGEGASVRIKSPISVELIEGESISVDGACLTVEETKSDTFKVFLSRETLKVTKFGRSLKRGDRVNLERAMRFGDRLGGHLVTGHVDCVGRLRRKRKMREGEDWEIEFPEEFRKYLIRKGSVAVDGVSLTVTRVERGVFGVTLIPFTLEKTTFRNKKEGDLLNLEFDIIGKFVKNLLKG